MKTEKPAIDGLSIRLVPHSWQADSWTVAFRNEGSAPLRDVSCVIAEGGIPSPGDLGSTITRGCDIVGFHPSDEIRIGSHRFTPGGDYLDTPLSASLISGEHILLTLNVSTNDFDRLESLRGSALEPASMAIKHAHWLRLSAQNPSIPHPALGSHVQRNDRTSSWLRGVIAGVVFGALSAAAMLPMEFPDKGAALLGAFLNRFAIGFVIGCVRLSWSGWAIGLMFGVLLSLPDAVITKAYAPILILGGIGGAVIGAVIRGKGKK